MTTLPATLKPELIHCNLKAGSKEESLRELVQVLAAHEPSIVIEEILQALDDRERKGPFSIAKGVAFPHARTEGVQEFTIVIGTKPGGLDFRAPDGQSVHIVILFVIPKKHSNLYLRTLAWFLNFFRDEKKTEQVASFQSPQEVVSAFGGETTQRQNSLFQECSYTVTQETPLRSVFALLAENKLEAIPVVTPEQTLLGEITLQSLFQNPPLRGMNTMAELLAAHGDSTMEPFITTDHYLEVESDQNPSDIAEKLTAQNKKRAYWIKNNHLAGGGCTAVVTLLVVAVVFRFLLALLLVLRSFSIHIIIIL